ncbi:MAG TPA: glycosyltransferase [Candidatus Omnitrophota bacterium]|nr:glycosyltransferase [Candidatus Omnitrophota bacterium]
MKKVLYLQYMNPAYNPLLMHGAAILRRDGWKVFFLAIASGAARKNIRFEKANEYQVLQLAYCGPGWRQKIHYLFYAVLAVGYSLFYRIDWIYASNPVSCPIALVMSFFPWFRILYHEHDTPPQGRGGSVFDAVINFSRNRLLLRCAIVVIPNLERIIKESVYLRIREKVFVVPNFPQPDEVDFALRPACGERFGLYYHGDISHKRIPLALIEAMTKVPDDVTLTIVGFEFEAGYCEKIQLYASRLGVSRRIKIFPPGLRRDLFLKCLSCGTVGVSLVPLNDEDINFRFMEGASQKTFEYMMCGLALLVPCLPNWRARFVESGYGLACVPDDAQSIASAINWFYSHPSETKAMGERGRERIRSEWNYGNAFSAVLNKLNLVTRGGSERGKGGHKKQ